MKTNTKNIYILGISCFYHDSAAVILKDGDIIAATQEERFTRKKHDESFPENAIGYCLKEAGITVNELTAVGFYEKPILKFDRMLTEFMESWPHDYKMFVKAISMWLKQKLWVRSIIKDKLGYGGPVYFSEHHMSHAASSFFASPFDEAAILTVDGVGEWSTTSFGYGKGNKISLLKEIHYPNSLGLFYSILTHYLGFKPNSAEYKVMGLAPYGKPVYYPELKGILNVNDDGSFEINRKVIPSYYRTGKIERSLYGILGFPKRDPADPLGQNHKDLAASLQKITDEAMVLMAKHVQKITNQKNLCLAGGVALNCVANSKILEGAGFGDIFIQPASGDAGGALGVAYYIWNQVLGNERSSGMKHCFWGPAFGNDEIKSFLEEKEVPYRFISDEKIASETAALIKSQNVIGWFQGRMEWGPRALGARSILADPRNKDNWQRVNLKIKFRESFRPFAPSVTREDSGEYFNFPKESPFMLFTARVKNDNIPAVTHIDGTARLQTVDVETNPLYHKLIREFQKITDCPVLINTSFNIRGEPIVCTPEDAFETFIKTDIDYLVLGNYILDKKDVSERYPFIKPQISGLAD